MLHSKHVLFFLTAKFHGIYEMHKEGNGILRALLPSNENLRYSQRHAIAASREHFADSICTRTRLSMIRK